MKIEKMTKMRSGKYKIEFDSHEKIIVYDDIILKHNLLYHSILTEAELNQLQKDNEQYEVYDKCVKFISKKIRSEKEIRDYIYKTVGEVREDIIQRLKNNGFINDKMFTSAFIYDKMNLSNNGPLKIKRELLDHHILEEQIDQELEKYTEDIVNEKLSHLMEKKIKANTKYSKYILKQKLVFYFSDLGYEKEKINYFFDQHYVGNDVAILKDYNKIKRTLEKKYPGEDIQFKIKQKLYQKGYLKEEIDDILN